MVSLCGLEGLGFRGRVCRGDVGILRGNGEENENYFNISGQGPE